MNTNSIISVACLLVSILLFLKYNSGLGGALGSITKRLTYLISILTFIAFIIFLNKAYYYSDNQNYKQITKDLRHEYSDLNMDIILHINESDLLINNTQIKIRELIRQIECDTTKENNRFQISQELKKEYYEYENMMISNKDSLVKKIQVKLSKIEKLQQQIVSDVHKENDTYVNIITNILSAFIAFVIAFTFKNRILG
jgi:hypothetical protein